MTTMVERVAQAIAGELGDEWESPTMFMLEFRDTHETCRDVYRAMARAAIEAMREPTDIMEAAAAIVGNVGSLLDGWAAMIDAALKEPANAG